MDLLDLEESAWRLPMELSRYVHSRVFLNSYPKSIDAHVTNGESDAVVAGVIPTNPANVNSAACSGY